MQWINKIHRSPGSKRLVIVTQYLPASLVRLATVQGLEPADSDYGFANYGKTPSANQILDNNSKTEYYLFKWNRFHERFM